MTRRWLIAVALVALLSAEGCRHISDPVTESDPGMTESGAVYG